MAIGGLNCVIFNKNSRVIANSILHAVFSLLSFYYIHSHEYDIFFDIGKISYLYDKTHTLNILRTCM